MIGTNYTLFYLEFEKLFNSINIFLQVQKFAQICNLEFEILKMVVC